MEEARVRGGLVGADLSKGNARIVVVSSLRCCDCTSCSSAERSIVSASLPNHSLPPNLLLREAKHVMGSCSSRR